jgi:hypothetical protein
MKKIKIHNLEVVFTTPFTLQEVEPLKDAIYDFLEEYKSKMDINLDFDLVVTDREVDF